MMKYSTSLYMYNMYYILYITAGSDFSPKNDTITFGELDRESCTGVEIINDNIRNEAPEVFEVNFLVSEENEDGIEIVNPVSLVTIIDDDTGMQGKIIILKVFS